MLENKSNNLGYFPSREEINVIIEHRKTNKNIGRLLDMLEQERKDRIKAEKSAKIWQWATMIVTILLALLPMVIQYLTEHPTGS